MDRYDRLAHDLVNVDSVEGQVIGENSRQDDMTVNVTKTKKLSNVRSAGADDKGDIGENRNPETHLIPNVINSVLNFTKLIVNGDSFDTKTEPV